MQQKSMTALISAFSRWYHARHNAVKVFDDTVAGDLLTEAEKEGISESMRNGIGFFNPDFRGSAEEALRWIVDNQLSPTPLGRAAFCEEHLQRAVSLGARQYLILAAGYDTFAYRQPAWAERLSIIELDHPATAEDKQSRLRRAGIDVPANVAFLPVDFAGDDWPAVLLECPAFDRSSTTLCSLLGISYHLTKERFSCILRVLSENVPRGSCLVFDYPDQDSHTGRAGARAKKQAMLAGGAKEAMLANYAPDEIERLLSAHGFLAYEHLAPDEITAQYFAEYNRANPSDAIAAFDNVNYCLAVRQP
ncbi:class I SAM-dependent methyltransferase [Eubacteriales bacterium OttesenSCG-928-A19]|nr:class I SAM-dependent methyltransferase [Eubacteriales bacterium OttesenSCG-928-A19]